jgi:hypothetical protein
MPVMVLGRLDPLNRKDPHMKTIAFAAFGLILAAAPAFAGMNCANRVHQVYKAPDHDGDAGAGLGQASFSSPTQWGRMIAAEPAA